MSDLKILYFCKYFIPSSESSYGGRAFNLFLELSKFDDVEIDVVASDSLGHLGNLQLQSNVSRLDYKNKFSAYFLKTFSYKKSKSFARIISWLDFELQIFKHFTFRVKNYDIIYASSPSFLTLITAFVLAKFFKKKLILEIRDIWPLTIIEEGDKSRYNPLIFIMGIIERFLYKKSDLIIGTMPGLGEHVNNNRLKSPLKSKINVVCIPLGVNLELREKTEKNSLIDINSYCHKNQLKIVYSGSIGISNALDNFFRLVVLFQNDNSVKFFILGDGPLLTQYQVKTRSYKNLIYLGKVPSVEVTSVLKQADILYLSNKPFKLWEYGQSLNKLIDYMYAGKIILMEYTGLISMINDSKSGFIVPHRNSSHMQDIIKYVGQLSESEKDQIGSKGKDWLLNNQSYQILANKLYNHLKQL